MIRREPTDAEWRQRVEAARAKAFAALKDGGYSAEGRYRLELGDDAYGAGMVCGNVGLVDGAMVFTDGDKTLAVKGFECEVDGLPLLLRDAFASACVRTRIWAEKGTLKVAWSMPGRKVVAADPVEPYGGAVPPSWRQDGDVVSFEADSNAFAYRLKYR